MQETVSSVDLLTPQVAVSPNDSRSRAGAERGQLTLPLTAPSARRVQRAVRNGDQDFTRQELTAGAPEPPARARCHSAKATTGRAPEAIASQDGRGAARQKR